MKIEKKNVLLIVPDGVGVKNYLYSNVFKELKNSSNLEIWSNLSSDYLKENIPNYSNTVRIQDFTIFDQPILSRFFWEASCWARLVYFSKKLSNPTLLFNRTRSKKYSFLSFFLFLSRLLGYIISLNYVFILWTEKLSRFLWEGKMISFYINILKKNKYDSILITHQRIVNLNPLCLAAEKLNIKVFSVIFSWDNIPKAKLSIKADYFLVWSDLMKKELNFFYPEIDNEKILITGTPQFEFYLEPERVLDREEFAKIYDLDANKKWICFSGDDHYTSPYDPLYVQDLLESLMSVDANSRPHIILRKAPSDLSDRYDFLKENFPDLITFINPILYTKNKLNWDGILTSYKDIDLLVNISFHCELVVNIGSTMALDFATFNKPCIFINYNTIVSSAWTIDTIYKFHHFNSLRDLSPVVFIDSKNNWSELILKIFENPLEFAPDKLTWFERIVLHPIDEASRNISSAITS
jgi:hypothetical protein